jgi:hypothetical protein
LPSIPLLAVKYAYLGHMTTRKYFTSRGFTIIACCIFLIPFCICQNLIVNPSFEQAQGIYFLQEATGATHGEWSISKFNGILNGWSCPFEFGRPSVHYKFNKFEVLTKPHTGDYAVGLTLYAPAKDDHAYHSLDYVDFLVGNLTDSIMKGEKYYFEVWVKNQKNWPNGYKRTFLANQSSADAIIDTSHVLICVQSSNIGLLFIQDTEAFLEKHRSLSSGTLELQELQPHFNYCDLIQENKEGWFKVQGSFVAPFNARHFVIGNFFSAEETKSSIDEHQRRVHYIRHAPFHKKIKDEREANYFIDDLLLRPANDIEYDLFKMNNCLLQERKDADSTRSMGLINYEPSSKNANPQRVCQIGNYKLAFTEVWSNCLSSFPADEVQDYLASGYQVKDGKSHLLKLAEKNDILCLNEAHVHVEHRAFLYSLLDSLHKKGYEYLFLEALSQKFGLTEYNNPAITPKTYWGPYVRDPVLGQVIEKAKTLGMKVIPYHPTEDQIDIEYQLLLEEFPDAKTDSSGWYMTPDGTEYTLALGQLTFTARDRAMAKNILSILSALDNGKAIIYGGGGHMNINSCGYSIPLRVWLDQLADYRILSFNQATLPEDITLMNIAQPSFVMLEDTLYATSGYCNIGRTRLKDTDGTIIHPSYSRNHQDRPDWLGLDGSRNILSVNIPENMSFPLVVVAYNSSQNYKTDVPIDAVEYTREIAVAELYLTSGCYDIFFVGMRKIEKLKKCY